MTQVTGANVDTTELDEDDLPDVINEIGELSGRYDNIATCLRVKANAVDRIKSECRSSDTALKEVVREWLKKNYNVDKAPGPPSWKILVEAVAKPAGGNDRALAEEIANRHQAEADPQPQQAPSSPATLSSTVAPKPDSTDAAFKLTEDSDMSIETDGEQITYECFQPDKKGQSSDVKLITFKKDEELKFETIAPITDKKPLKNDDVGAYDMKCWPHGKALIINNVSFKKKMFRKKLSTREGTEIDEENLISIFRYLGYIVEVHRERSSKEIRKIMEKVSMEDHSQFDSFVCCILSHGKAGYVYGTDREKVSLEEITNKFNGNNSLEKMPKLFFLQACRGEKKNCGVEADSDEEEMKIPVTLDFYIGYATALDYVSWRDKGEGSWFISELCKCLATYAKYLSLHQIMTIVIRKVSSHITDKRLNVDTWREEQYVQSPEVVTRLKKDVFFFRLQ